MRPGGRPWSGPRSRRRANRRPGWTRGRGSPTTASTLTATPSPRCGTGEAAEDLVQDTLLAAWRARAEFAGRASERTWLTAILKRKAVDWLRRRVRERLRSASDEPDGFAAGLFTRRGVWKA